MVETVWDLIPYGFFFRAARPGNIAPFRIQC